LIVHENDKITTTMATDQNTRGRKALRVLKIVFIWRKRKEVALMIISSSAKQFIS
jgi:hypothetical protein